MEEFKPNQTPMPDWMIDELMPTISGAAYMLASLLVRHSLGNGHQEVKFSAENLAFLTGLESKEVAKGIYDLLESKYFLRRAYEDSYAYKIYDATEFGFIFGLVPLVYDPIEPSQLQQNSLDWFQKMHATFLTMSITEKLELEEWEKSFLYEGSTKSTSDWPEWEKLIGLPPWRNE